MFIYAKATSSPHPPSVPRGIDKLMEAFGKDFVFSVVAGLHTGYVATSLNKEIDLMNTIISAVTNPLLLQDTYSDVVKREVIDWVGVCVNPIFGDGTGFWDKSYDGRYESERYSGYGYLLLGIAFARLSKPMVITYAGLGMVSVAEYSYHSSLATCQQYII